MLDLPDNEAEAHHFISTSSRNLAHLVAERAELRMKRGSSMRKQRTWDIQTSVLIVSCG